MAAASSVKRGTTGRARGARATAKGSRATARGPSKTRKLQVIEGGRSSRVIAQLDDDFLVCRTEFHRWDTKGFYDDGLITMFQMCERCGTERTARYTRNGRLEGTRYKHPAGYEIHGHGPIERYKLRAERFGRVKMYRTEDEMMKHVMAGS